jgi:hypothetical protein
MAAMGTSRHFAATQQFGRFRSEADIQRAALTEPDLWVRVLVEATAALLDDLRAPQSDQGSLGSIGSNGSRQTRRPPCMTSLRGTSH